MCSECPQLPYKKSVSVHPVHGNPRTGLLKTTQGSYKPVPGFICPGCPKFPPTTTQIRYGEKKAHETKLFALVRVQLTLGQPAGFPDKEVYVFSLNPENINFFF